MIILETTIRLPLAETQDEDTYQISPGHSTSQHRPLKAPTAIRTVGSTPSPDQHLGHCLNRLKSHDRIGGHAAQFYGEELDSL